MNTIGRHLLVEFHGCDAGILNDVHRIEALMCLAAREAGATIVASTFHPFAEQGVSGVVVVAESHLSIHTWPEYGYAAADFYTCGDCVPERAYDALREGLRSQTSEIMRVRRGIPAAAPGMEVIDHCQERTEPSSVPLRGPIALRQGA